MLRLLHLTATLLSGYVHMLRTEAEIILSMLARTLDADEQWRPRADCHDER